MMEQNLEFLYKRFAFTITSLTDISLKEQRRRRLYYTIQIWNEGKLQDKDEFIINSELPSQSVPH